MKVNDEEACHVVTNNINQQERHETTPVLDIYKQTSVFDFIHSQQINLECSQLDKENSHFIIADISIAAFELIKSQELAEQTKDQAESDPSGGYLKPIANKIRHASHGIKINNSMNNHSKPRCLKKFDSPSRLNSPNTTHYLDDFGTTSMALSMEQELIINSGYTSPNPDLLSCSSSIGLSKTDEAVPAAHSSSTRKLSNAQSLLSLNLSGDTSRQVHLLPKSASSLNLYDLNPNEHNEKNDQTERLRLIRERWIMAARKALLYQKKITFDLQGFYFICH